VQGLKCKSASSTLGLLVCREEIDGGGGGGWPGREGTGARSRWPGNRADYGARRGERRGLGELGREEQGLGIGFIRRERENRGEGGGRPWPLMATANYFTVDGIR
jgi:hypothetical protein